MAIFANGECGIGLKKFGLNGKIFKKWGLLIPTFFILGDQFKTTSATDFNDIKATGRYKSYSWDTLSHFPTGANQVGILDVKPGVDGNWVVQKYYGAGGDMWERSLNSGNEWVRVDNFGCNSLSALASALGDISLLSYQGWTNDVDANNISWGIVYTGERCSNLPENYCYLLTMGDNSTSSEFVQIAVGRVTGSLYFRIRKDANAWKRVQVTE